MSQSVYALELKELKKEFGGIVAASNINIKIPEHTIYGIIGPNGAGKTTMFNMITGVYPPTSGDILYFGESIVKKKTYEIANIGIARTFQNIRLFANLTVYENLLTSCQQNITYNLLQGILRTPAYKRAEKEMEERCLTLLKSVDLLDVKEKKASALPYGAQRRLEIVRALVTGPKILLLDEPAAGMNEEESAQLSQIVKKIQSEFKITIVIIDHHMDVIMDVCDEISVINFGKLIATGTPQEAQDNEEVRDAYLGVNE